MRVLSRGLILVSLIAAMACAPKRARWDDPSLPEAAADIPMVAPLGVLAEGADSDDPSVRGRALDLLIRADSDPAGDWARRALWDPDPWVQRRGVTALTSRIDAPGATDLLEQYVRRTDAMADAYAQGSAALRLVEVGDVDVATDVANAWPRKTDFEAPPLQLAALALGDAAALEPLGAHLAQGEVALEPEFVLDLGRSGDTRLVPYLATGQEWVEDELQLAWATARLQLGDKDAAKLLHKALDGDDPLAALEALDFLSALPGEASTELIRKARSGGTDIAQAYAAMALAARGEGTADPLEDAVLSDDPELRALAARFAADTLAQHDPPRRAEKVARKVLEQALVDEALAVRVAALRSAATLGVLVPEPPVRAQLVDELLAVRIEAAGALLARGG